MTRFAPQIAPPGGPPSSVRGAAPACATAVTIVLLVILPTLVYYIWFCLAFNRGQLMLPSLDMLDRFPLPTATSVAIVVGWLIVQALLQVYAPGNWVEGTPLPDETRLKYKMNGWSAWLITWTVLVVGVALQLLPPAILADQFGAL